MTEIIAKFKIGDRVELKSSGPIMTVSELLTEIQMRGPALFNGKVTCRWFNASHEPKQETFHQDELEVVEDDNDMPFG